MTAQHTDVSKERVVYLKAQSVNHLNMFYQEHPGYMESVRRQAAKALAHSLYEAGCITFETKTKEVSPGISLNEQTTTATVRVVHPSQMVTMEERVKEKAIEMMDNFVALLSKDIENWNSQTGYRGYVAKHQVYDSIGVAMRKVKK